MGETKGVSTTSAETAAVPHIVVGGDNMVTPNSKRTTLAPRAWRTVSEHLIGFPDVPATYAIFLDGQLGYIGQSFRLSARLSSYRIRINLFDDPQWVTPWGKFEDVVIKYKLSYRYGDWLMREARLIRRLNPRFNQYGITKARAQ